MTTDDKPLDASGGPAYPTLSVVKSDEFGGERMQDVPGMTLHDRAALELFGRLMISSIRDPGFRSSVDDDVNENNISPARVIARISYDFARDFLDEREDQPVSDTPLPGAEMLKHAATFVRVIAEIDVRCMAVDGPVTPTLREITDEEMGQLFRAAQGIIAASGVRDDDETGAEVCPGCGADLDDKRRCRAPECKYDAKMAEALKGNDNEKEN